MDLWLDELLLLSVDLVQGCSLLEREKGGVVTWPLNTLKACRVQRETTVEDPLTFVFIPGRLKEKAHLSGEGDSFYVSNCHILSAPPSAA